MHFLDNLRTITQEGSTETRQMTGFFIYFFCSNFLQYLFLYLKIVKIHFLVVPPLVYSGLQHTSIPVCRGVHIHYFKINNPTLRCPVFSENYLNPLVRINKIVHKYTANYLPIIIILWTSKDFISPESFLNLP